MANPSKAKGTAAESAIVRYLQANGFAGALRPALSGSKDCGDIWCEPGPTVIIESKNVAGPAALGAPPAAQLDVWWMQTLAERLHAGADLGVLVVKRKGTSDPGKWFAWAPAWLILAAHHHGDMTGVRWSLLLDAPIGLTLAQAVYLLRAAGYGDAIEPELTIPRFGLGIEN